MFKLMKTNELENVYQNKYTGIFLEIPSRNTKNETVRKLIHKGVLMWQHQQCYVCITFKFKSTNPHPLDIKFKSIRPNVAKYAHIFDDDFMGDSAFYD